MAKHRVGKITLACTFILLGSSILWNMHSSQPISILRYYPLILIILGVELILKAILRKEDKISLDGGIIFLLIFLFFLFNFFSFTSMGPYYGLNQNGILIDRVFFENLFDGEIRFNFSGRGDYRTRFDEERIFDEEEIEEFHLTHSFGDITINTWDEDYVKLELSVLSENDDEEFVLSSKNDLFDEDFDDGVLRIQSNTRKYLEPRTVHSFRVNYQVYLPENADIRISHEFGNIDVDGAEGEVDITNRHGNVRLDNTYGPIGISNRFGDISVSDIRDGARIENRHGNITITASEEIKENLEIENEFGNIRLSILDDQEGSYLLETTFGKIDHRLALDSVERMNEVKVSGTIIREHPMIRISNRHGNIRIR